MGEVRGHAVRGHWPLRGRIQSIVSVPFRLFRGSRGRVAADAAARVWNALLSFALFPVYLHFIGAESFGVVGIYATVQAVIALFDCSLAPTLTRELARTRAGRDGWGHAYNLTRTLEVVYWGLAAVAGGLFVILVPFLSGYWLNPEKLSAQEVSAALYVAALGLAFLWPNTLYAGGLVGLEKQKALAFIGVAGSTVRAAATIFFLWAVSPSVETIFWVGAVLGLLQTLVTRLVFWRAMPDRHIHGVFQANVLKDIWRFAAGVSAITITSVILLQADKLTLSRLLRLEDFGYYTISTSIANALFIVTGAVFSVTFPRLSGLVVGNHQSRLAVNYHLFCQGVAFAVLPISAVVAFFSQELLLLWTRDPQVALYGHSVLTVFILGNVFNCLLSVPYTMQLALGLTRVAIMANAVALVLAFPAIALLFGTFGPLSGPIVWGLVNLGLLVTLTGTLHRRSLRGEGLKWVTIDAGLPMIVSFAMAAIMRYMLPTTADRWDTAAQLIGTWLFAASCTFLVLPELRRQFVLWIRPT